MIATCSKCQQLFETTQEDAYTPGVMCAPCYREVHGLPTLPAVAPYRFTRENGVYLVTVPDAQHPMGWRKLDGSISVHVVDYDAGRVYCIDMHEPVDEAALGAAFERWMENQAQA